jgi:hypothetical protein
LGEVAVTSLTGTLTRPKLTDPLHMARGMPAFFPMEAESRADQTPDVDVPDVDVIEAAAQRLATLLTAGGGGLRDPGGRDLVFEPSLDLRPLARADEPPGDVWAVDGGQALVADARCLQVYATRASRVRWQGGRGVLEETGPLAVHLLGLGEEREALARSGAPVAADAAVDVNLLRDWGEWSAVASCVSSCAAGGMVLVDGDLQPDWRIPSSWLATLLSMAAERKVTLVGVTKHSSLSYGGAPLLGLLERRGAAALGPRACWWVPVAHTRGDTGVGIAVYVARLDPDARFAFRVDLAADVDPGPALAALAALADDAAFPGYPFPLSVADRLASCPEWVRDEVWAQIEDGLDRAGVAPDVRERAFADRHRLMERA